MRTFTSVVFAAILPVVGFAWEYAYWDPNGYGAWSETTRWVDGKAPTELGRDNVMFMDVDAWMEDGDFQLASNLTRIRFGGTRASLDLRFATNIEGHFWTMQLENEQSKTLARVYKSGAGTFFHDGTKNYYFAEYFVTNGTLKLGSCERMFTNMVYGAFGPGVLELNNTANWAVKGFVGDGTLICDATKEVELWGDVHHAWKDDAPFVFSGTVGENFSPTVKAGRHHFTGYSTSAHHTIRMYGGELGVQVFGQKDQGGSMGSLSFYNFFAPSRLLYLGAGESTAEPVPIQFLNGCAEATLDGGATGGLKVGYITVNNEDGFNLVLDGSNATACVLGGTIVENPRARFSMTKKGCGVWRFGAREQTKFNGPIFVEEGTVECATLAPTNVACSVGGATNLGSFAAFTLGTASTVGTLAYTGTGWARPWGRTIEVTGKGRLLSSDDADTVASWSDVSAKNEGTLTLDGAGLYDSVNNISGNSLGVEKSGIGTWALGGNIAVAKTDVKQGTLVVNSVTDRYSWYRFTVKKLWGATESNFQCAQIALFDADGRQQNLNLETDAQYGVCYVLGDGEAQFDHPFVYYSADRSLDKVFKGTDGLMTVGRDPNKAVAAESPDTWISFTMRLPMGVKPVKYYSVRACNYTTGGKYARDASNFMLEGSVDGRVWEVLDERVLTEPYQTKSSAYGWYHWAVPSEKDKFGFELTKTAPAPRTVDLGTVSVAEGARLQADAPVVVSSICIDATGAGTNPGAFENVVLASTGTINVLGADKDTRLLPISFENVTGLKNLESWTLLMNGVPSRTRTLAVTSDGKLTLMPKGLLLIVK